MERLWEDPVSDAKTGQEAESILTDQFHNVLGWATEAVGLFVLSRYCYAFRELTIAFSSSKNVG